MVFSVTPKTVAANLICGMDEAGRGPWAGPVVAAACMFPQLIHLPGLNDSKQLTSRKREELHKKITQKAWTGVGMASEKEIDQMGLLPATNLAFTRALHNLVQKNGGTHPRLLLIDGKDKFQFPYASKSIVRGDEKVRVISAASVVAKVERDAIMQKLAQKFPQYGFEVHKGYGTQRHQQALKQHGVCEIHRKTFRPVREHGTLRAEHLPTL